MAFRLIIGGYDFGFTDYNVQEAATPLAAGDSSGQVGTISFTVPFIDAQLDPHHPRVLYGENWVIGREVRLEDSRKGFTLGKVNSIQPSRSSATNQITASSRLGELNVYNVQAPPFVGILADAFQQYLKLANVTTGFLVDPSIASRSVVFPGWNGELWYSLKQMAAAIDCDISLVSGVILLRPIRQRVATRGRDVDRSSSTGGGSLAQYISVMQYNNRPITNELVYPPGGWSEDVTVINVNAGESVEEVLELSASVSSISQPLMQTFVSQAHNNSSVYTVVGDDGLPIIPAQWSAQGGRLEVEINPDTTSLTVKITAPTGIRNKDGKEIGVYGISLSSDSGTGRYSTLRILGSGVAFFKEEVRVPTGVSDSETSTEVGVTIDNPFLSSRDDVYTAGVRAVRSYSGTAMSISGSVTAINQRGSSGKVNLLPYSEFQSLYQGQTYAQVQSANTGKTYLQVQEAFNAGVEDDFENQVFGNVAGARIWDESSRRWYRIRTGTPSPSLINFEAEDDLIHQDVYSYFSGETYEEMQIRYNGFSYREVDLMGLRPVLEIGGPPLNPSPALFPDTRLFPSRTIL